MSSEHLYELAHRAIRKVYADFIFTLDPSVLEGGQFREALYSTLYYELPHYDAYFTESVMEAALSQWHINDEAVSQPPSGELPEDSIGTLVYLLVGEIEARHHVSGIYVAAAEPVEAFPVAAAEPVEAFPVAAAEPVEAFPVAPAEPVDPAKMRERNIRKLKELVPGEELEYHILRSGILLLGPCADTLQSQSSGMIRLDAKGGVATRIRRGKLGSAGKITFDEHSVLHKDLLRKLFSEITAKELIFPASFAALTFEAVMNDQLAYEEFKQFACNEHTEESFHFLEAVKRYSKGPRPSIAEEICNRFLRDGCAEPINIDHGARLSALAAVADGRENPFVDAVSAITDMVKNDTFRRYKSTLTK
ncbi:hypothetical protein [Streptomyces chartreusis]|uniref:hypothetical protein n=1 Tax=Streptomyces chartreusis TaxID=1969 RepID=UPI0033E4FAE8